MDQNSHYLDVVYMEFSAVVYISRDSGHNFFSRSNSPGKKIILKLVKFGQGIINFIPNNSS